MLALLHAAALPAAVLLPLRDRVVIAVTVPCCRVPALVMILIARLFVNPLYLVV